MKRIKFWSFVILLLAIFIFKGDIIAWKDAKIAEWKHAWEEKAKQLEAERIAYEKRMEEERLKREAWEREHPEEAAELRRRQAEMERLRKEENDTTEYIIHNIIIPSSVVIH